MDTRALFDFFWTKTPIDSYSNAWKSQENF